MGVKFGEIDASQILLNEYSIIVLTETLEWVFKNNPGIKKPREEHIGLIKRKAVDELKKKYPKSGIELKEE